MQLVLLRRLSGPHTIFRSTRKWALPQGASIARHQKNEPWGDASLLRALHHFRFFGQQSRPQFTSVPGHAVACLCQIVVLIGSGLSRGGVLSQISSQRRALADLALKLEGGVYVRWRHAPSVRCCSAHSDASRRPFRPAQYRDNSGLSPSLGGAPVIERLAASRQRLHRSARSSGNEFGPLVSRVKGAAVRVRKFRVILCCAGEKYCC